MEQYLRNLILIFLWEVHPRVSLGESCREGMLFIL